MMTATRTDCPSPLLIVTDLDGTLLDHHDYSFAAALPALERAATAGIPVIPNTSKTRHELLDLRETLGLSGPFIVENGSAILIPVDDSILPCDDDQKRLDGYCIHCLGRDYSDIRAALAQLVDRFQFSCFGDWTLDELQAQTGLDPASAQAAREREYSEALKWLDSDSARRRFVYALQALGLKALQGGRFVSVLGQTDKGRALTLLCDLYQRATGTRPTVIALGDGDNDIDMLEAADIAVVIANDTRSTVLKIDAPEVIYSTYTGPQGWNETVQALLDRFTQP